MRWLVLCFLMVVAWAGAWAQSTDDAYSAALAQSLARSRALYPDSALPNTPLGEAMQSQIAWLQQNDPNAFSDPNWPMRVASAAASALGIAARSAAPAPPPTQPAPVDPAAKRYLGLVTKNFSVVGASFRKNQQIILESLQDYNKRGTTIVDGKPVLLWLDNIQVLRELPPDEAIPSLIKVESAKYGFPGKSAQSVAPMVQSLVAPTASGAQGVLVSDALLTPAAAQKLNRSAAPTYLTDPATGAQVLSVPYKVLTVVYTINGERKTKQEVEGRILTLD